MSLVLYRKYRPQKFSDFIGQEHIIQTLKNAVSSGLISHAYLFAGPRGSGKTTLARILAKALNCQNRKSGDYEPCNQCTSCLEITEGRSMDLVEIDAASHRGIDDVRELRDGIKFVPVKSKYRIFIIDESHQLTKEAANALLKTLEEPPDHAIFILATTEVHKMIPTIVSRCQRFDFKKLTLSEILKKLTFICEKEKIKIEKEALELIALNSQGSFRDAESLLDQVVTLYGQKEIRVEEIKDLLGLVENELISKFCDLLVEKNSSGAINFLNDIVEKGLDLEEFTKTLINYLRKILLLKITIKEKKYLSNKDVAWLETGMTKEEFQKIKELAEKFNEEELKNFLNLFLDAQNKIKYSPIPQLPLELAVVEICQKI